MVKRSAIEGLKEDLRGRLIQPEDDGYDAARHVYNAMINRYPRLIARCADVADVGAVVRFTRDHDLPLAIRGGGHNGAGLGTCDDGVVLDLSALRGVDVDPKDRTVRVQGGCTSGDVDQATHAFGLAVPTGVISTTGIAGLALGGGSGYLSRRYGLTIDNLVEAEVVLADGRVVTASVEQNTDLFWALRGGGGNFGVVTTFLFRAHPVHTVYAGLTLWPLERAAEILGWYREFMPAAPDELYGFFSFNGVPPTAPFPAELHGQQVCGVVWCYCGPEDGAEKTMWPVRQLKPVFEYLAPLPFPALQSFFDPFYPPGLQWYWRGDFLSELPDEAIARHVEHGSRPPSPLSLMHLYPVDGAAARVGRNDTAFSYREAKWNMVIAGVDPDPTNRERIASWARAYWQDLHPHGAGGAYVNFLMDEGEARVRATYRDNYDRLARIKRKYDPDNLFRVNQNIRPATRG
ncbi:MAG: FAD-binding oxidoreductase [Thiogranum sp.]|jgi:FAD/FMN-containing dehydrogenase